MSVFELPTVTLIPNGIHHPPIEDGRLLPNSVKIFYALETYKEMCVCDLAEILTASVATTSHHLRFLKKHGMAKSRQDGKVVYYSLANEDILSAIRVF